MLKIGHRGAKGYVAENTLASFQKAIELGVDIIELDVHLSLDDKIMVIHDETVDRTTTKKGFVNQYKASELQNKTIKLEEDSIGLDEVVIRPKNKPKNTNLATQPSNIKQHFQKHKLVYAGLGGIVGLLLLLTSIKKLK
jgi:glycerophosphoryl diester phosphodiesterase